MNVSRLVLALLLTLFPGQILAQGFAGLGADSDGFAKVTPGAELSFPKDHGAHPDYRIEWWYITANLRDADGNYYGVQWTLFRQAMAPPPQKPGWQNQQIWLGHAALTSGEKHLTSELVARGKTGQAGVQSQPFVAWIDDWELASSTNDGGGELSSLRLRTHNKAFSYDLELTSEHPLILHGQLGFSQKSNLGQASYYYSQPFYSVLGTLLIDDVRVDVTGDAWLDREWSSQPLAGTQTGWDWFSLHLDNGEKVMLFRLRDEKLGNYYSGTWISASGEPEQLAPEDITFVPLTVSTVAQRQIPTEWRLQVPRIGIDLKTTPLNRDSWMDTSIPYWEGPIQFSGSHSGVGYLEMTGYDPKP